MQVEARTVGQRGAVLEPTPVAMPPGPATLREVVVTAVRDEVANHAARERRRRLVRVLTADEVADGAARGKVDPEAHPAEDPVDADQAVAAALQAFDDGLYFVFVDDRQVEQLDDTIEVTDDTAVRFVRLVALAGG